MQICTRFITQTNKIIVFYGKAISSVLSNLFLSVDLGCLPVRYLIYLLWAETVGGSEPLQSLCKDLHSDAFTGGDR